MKPDFDRAAIVALEVLLENGINSTPIIPLPVLKRMPGVQVKSLTELSETSNMQREKVRSLFGQNMDAMTFHIDHPRIRYVVVYNQRLPFYSLQRGLARELGHIVLGHDGKRLPEDVRMAEAFCFAHHFLCPRPLVQAVQEAGVPLTVEVLGSMTGCYERCIKGMRKIPGTNVPAELNRRVRAQFRGCLEDFIELERLAVDDDPDPVDLGSFMDGYKE